jgi:hypothetical protein
LDHKSFGCRELNNLEEIYTMITRGTNIDNVLLNYHKFAGKKVESAYSSNKVQYLTVKEPKMKCIYRYSNYFGQTNDPSKRHSSHQRMSAFYKKIQGEEMQILYWCLPHNANRYEKREIYDALKREEHLENDKHNYTKYNVLEVEKTEEFKKVAKQRELPEKQMKKLRELPKGISIDNKGFRVQIKGIRKRFKTLEDAIEFMRDLD